VKSVSGKRLCAILAAKGWLLARISGSHHIYFDPTTDRTVSVPVHGNQSLGIGLQRRIMRQAGITAEEL
jgi:predicted RNA binding protein YcfA (HicA-like mRNA interferase family)